MKINPVIAQVITDTFIDGLKAGRIPWKRQWKNGTSSYGGKWSGFISESVNFQTKKHYNGLNALLLDSFGHSVPVWGTSNQWYNNGYIVKKDERGIPTIYWNIFFFDEKGNFLTREQYNALSGEQQKKCVKRGKLRYDKVFHINQVKDNVSNFTLKKGQIKGVEGRHAALLAKWAANFATPEPVETVETPVVEPFRHEMAETIVSRWGISVKHESQDRAYYAPSVDVIMMPT